MSDTKQMPTWLRSKRGTGRTTRMLRAIRDECKSGAYIFAVMENGQMRDRAQRLFEESLPSFDGQPTFKHVNGKTYWNGAQVSWETCEDPEFDWHSMRFRHSHPSCLVFVDPSCVEIKFHRLLGAWHRFDEQQ